MSELRRKFSTIRRPSTMLEGPASSSTPDSTSRSATPSIFSRTTRRLRGVYDGTFKDRTSDLDMVKPPPKSTTISKLDEPPSRPGISGVAKTFASAMSTARISDFLIWFLYYDVVDLPDTPENWYDPFNSTDMRGWIALGSFLLQLQAVGQGYGLDLPVLDSICDRLRLQKSLVHDILIKFSSPSRMKYGLLATTVKLEEEKGTMTLAKLALFQSKLTDMHKLAVRLRPTSGTQYVAWQLTILERIDEFLRLYIAPQVVRIKEQGPLLEYSTNLNLPKEVMEGVYLAYLFEVMQLERKVPLAKYDVQDGEEPALGHGLAPLSRLEQDCGRDTAQEIIDLQEQYNNIKKENGDLKAKVEQLEVKLTIAVSVLEDHTGKKVMWTEVSSSVDDETFPSGSPTTDESEADNNELSTTRCSWPYGADVPAASISGRSTPDRRDRRPERHEDYLKLARAEEVRHRRSRFVGMEEVYELGISGVDPLTKGTTIVQQGEEREE